MKLQVLPLDKKKPLIEDESQLNFGKQFTDRMFVMQYKTGQGWHDARIQPYQAFSLDPAAMVLHYAQEIFEGLKAFRRPDGEIALFRPQDNFRRFNHGARRMCMPEVDEAFMLKSLKELIRLEADWVPHSEGTSLYIRPALIASEPMLGVRPADEYLCFIILCPVGAYYKGGLAPVKIWISDHYVRAAHGGTGEVKTGGNYAASLYAAREAEEKGYDQVLWLDADHLAGDVGGLVRGEEDDGGGDLLRRGDPVHGDQRQDHVQHAFVTGERGREAGIGQPRQHRVDPHLPRCAFLGEGLGHADHRGLGD